MNTTTTKALVLSFVASALVLVACSDDSSPSNTSSSSGGASSSSSSSSSSGDTSSSSSSSSSGDAGGQTGGGCTQALTASCNHKDGSNCVDFHGLSGAAKASFQQDCESNGDTWTEGTKCAAHGIGGCSTSQAAIGLCQVTWNLDGAAADLANFKAGCQQAGGTFVDP